ncbi:DUF4472 domain-containing protein [Burkholderia multivorans]|uniref:DUF4472 domain-containing protein n=1 Tax=Burkholderia multivorans TaxID=87883 RepID=UPI0021BF7C21|nr:DUF4472 domain-containing protein [Burkholderia multivorans]HEM7850382.1 hypothetical protein [Burkholderia multivorans]
MENWKDNLGRHALRIASVSPKSFAFGVVIGIAISSYVIWSSLHLIPWPGGPFVWISESERDALKNDLKNLQSRASELESVRDGLLEKNAVLEAKLATSLDRRQACGRLEREISAKEAQISALTKAREDAVHRAAPISVPLDGSRLDYAGIRTPETDRYDADINLLKSSLQAIRERVAQSCI